MSKKTVAVIGVGRVGLPMCLVLAESNNRIYGIGRNQEKIDLLNHGIMPFMEKGAEVLLKKHINKNLFFTTSYENVSKANVLILTLGTPVDENMNPVYDQIDDSLAEIIPHLKNNTLMILRSTVSPRSTEYVKNMIEQKTRYSVGRDIFLAFCPERVAEGNSIEETRQVPQIVGGIDSRSTDRAIDFFKSYGIRCLPTDSISAELAKLFTNMYRYISFAIANEFMVIAENFDKNIHEIVDLVNRNYKRGGLVLPGLTAGPCLFKDGFFLVNENPFLDLIVASWKINEALPLFMIKKLREKINLKNKKVAILGLAFKPEIDDTRESLSFKIRKSLIREQATVSLHDPYVREYKRQDIKKSINETVAGADVVIIATRHKYYDRKKSQIKRMLKKRALIVDIWNMFATNKLIFGASELR